MLRLIFLAFTAGLSSAVKAVDDLATEPVVSELIDRSMLSLLLSLLWLIPIFIAALLLFAILKLLAGIIELLHQLASLLRRAVMVAFRAVVMLLTALAGGFATAAALPAVLEIDPSPVTVAAAGLTACLCAALFWRATGRWGGARAAYTGPGTPSGKVVIAKKIRKPTPAALSPAPLVDPDQMRCIVALEQDLRDAATRDPFDIAISEGIMVCARVAELIDSVEAVYAEAAPDERPALRAGLSHDLHMIITDGQARLRVSRSTARAIARDRLATLRHYVAARTTHASL